MSLFDSFRKKSAEPEPQSQLEPQTTQPSPTTPDNNTSLARLALNSVQEGFIIADGNSKIKMINPAAINMIGLGDETLALGFDLSLCMKFEDQDGKTIPEDQNPFFHAVKTNQSFTSRDLVLIAKDSGTKTSVELSVIPTDGISSDRIINFRDINKELETENEQSEFISTASHEMRTPVASIEGYLSLALNPQTATIDQRAKNYLEAAHNASKHLGELFRNLLDVTKLDDRKVKPNFVPLELTSFVKQLANNFLPQFQQKNLTYTFGAKKSDQNLKTLPQTIYTYVDTNFLQESVSNLIENAIKYTHSGGHIWINVDGDETKAYISVADDGMGIPSNDLEHIFQKFYRSDNSQTREIGGTGLGLYLVKQRTEVMGGSVWAESAYGSGSTFTIALPRLTPDEYEKRRIALINETQIQAAIREQQFQTAKTAVNISNQSSPPPALTQPVDQPQAAPPAPQNPTPPTQNQQNMIQ